jgi:hypothetical protein
LQFRLADVEENTLSSDALPTSLSLTDFTGSSDLASFLVTGPGFGTVSARFDSVTIEPVSVIPLPASVPLLIGGLGLLSLLRRRRA